MSLFQRLQDFRRRRAAGKRRAQAKAISERRHAEIELALDDFAWDGRLPKDTGSNASYPASLSDGFEDSDEPRGDW